MKKLIIPIVLLTACLASRGDVIRQWDFNSQPSDFDRNTGSTRPTDGHSAPAYSCGGVGNRFGYASNATQPDDPNTLDNSQWRLGQTTDPITAANLPDGFPTASNANKTAGAILPANSSGYHNISIDWNQENSAAASKYWRLQYTINGVDWLDTPKVITASSTDPAGAETDTPAWQKGLSFSFAGISGVDDNPNFAVRFVSEFEFTALGAGSESYIGNRAGTTYGTGGTMWLDMITVSGDVIDPGNNWPTVSVIPDQVIRNGEMTFGSFEISDSETAADDLVVTAYTTDPSLITSLMLAGSGSYRTVTVTAAAAKLGTASVVVRVRDAGGKVSETAFNVTVVVPAIFPIAGLTTTSDAAVTAGVITTNMPGNPATEWTMTAGSSDPSIVPVSGIVFGPGAVSNYVTLTPVLGAAGGTTITITNTGPNGLMAVRSFTVNVLAPPVVYFDLTGLSGSAPAPVTSKAATIVSNGLAVTTISRGSGLNAYYLGNGFSANGSLPGATGSAGRTAAIAANEYFEFAVTIQPGYTLSIASLDHALRRSATAGPMHFEWQYSFDGFATTGVVLTNFLYRGRDSGTAPANVAPYQWMTTDTPGQGNGNMVWPFLFGQVAALQKIPAGTTITFRLYFWGEGSVTDSNTTALGRVFGPRIRGTVDVAPIKPESPPLRIRRSGSDVIVSWPSSATGFFLQQASSLPAASWQPAGLTPTIVGDENVVTISNPSGTLFLRLSN
jgi:hypothetical protein